MPVGRSSRFVDHAIIALPPINRGPIFSHPDLISSSSLLVVAKPFFEFDCCFFGVGAGFSEFCSKVVSDFDGLNLGLGFRLC